jgi:hypothetical protein
MSNQIVPKVVIFGAGITGLTAAHELIERGWDVTVVEKEIDPLNVDECAIGGLAKTQWSVYQATGARTRPVEARPMVPTVRLRLDRESTHAHLRTARGKVKVDEDTPVADLPGRLSARKESELEEALHTVLDVGSQLYLARVATRLRSICPGAPVLIINFFSCANSFVTFLLRAYLEALGGGKVTIPDLPDPSLPNGVWQVETNLHDKGENGDLPRDPGDFSGIIPGEHGFRFFPALYRHVFDTLRRIPVRGEGQNFGDVYRTVYDNLVPTEANWLAVDDSGLRPGSTTAKRHGVVRFPRRLRKSMREMLDAMDDMQTELGYTERDLELLKLRLLKYMTSCLPRRNEQYESMSWSDFMGMSDLSDACKQDMQRAPQLLAAMTAEDSDARTQGNLATQLMLDPINADERVDSTLNAPTSVAWFAPWKDYLLSQGVRFIPGALVGFNGEPITGTDPTTPKVIRPKMDDGDRSFNSARARIDLADYYVLALPVQAWSDKKSGLVKSWEEARTAVAGEPNDHVDRLSKWINKHVESKVAGSNNSGLYKDLTGIQFYFDSDDLARSGHTLLMDSPWRLCAISQASFWNRRRESFDCYRGIVSVDIGSLANGSKLIKTPDGQVPGEFKSFNETPRTDVPWSAWRQVYQGYSDFSKGIPAAPPYSMYRLDEYIKYGPENELPPRNLAPFLINGINEWDCRAGWDKPIGEEPDSSLAEEDSCARYQLMPRYSLTEGDDKAPRKAPPAGPRWVMAGTFMQTWTRATTMESANESARHAVNTLLDDATRRFSRMAQPCRIWNPEEYEHPDLRIFRELDEKLYGPGGSAALPHMFDILELDSIPDTLLETKSLTEIMARMVDKGSRQ